MPAPTHYKPRTVLRENLKACMATKAGPNSQGELFRKSGVAQGTIGRILKAEGENARIETVGKLAKAYGLEAWQLMVPGMDPGNPPVLQPVSKAERELYERLHSAAEDLAKLKR